MTSTQSNTQSGLVKKLVSTATLVDKEGYLAKLVNGTGAATVELAGDGELAAFVITEGAAVDAYAELKPLNPNDQVRIISSGTIAGGTLVSSDSNGKIAAAAVGEYVIGVLEEDAVAGQLALVRPIPVGSKITAATAYTATVGANLGAFTDPPTAGEMAALRTFVNALKADTAAIEAALMTHGILS